MDNKIVPIEFARTFDGNIRRVKIDGVWFFSILDMFAHYGQSSNARRDWKRTQDKLTEQGFAVVPKTVQYQFERSDGQLNRPTPCVNFNTLLRIAQVVDFKQWEYLRQYMADIAEEKILGHQNALPETTERGVLRLKGKDKRNYFELTIDETLAITLTPEQLGKHIAILTNVTYRHILGAWKQKLVERYHLTKTQARNFRDEFGKLTLSAIAYVEEAASFEMQGKHHKLTEFEQNQIVDNIAEDMADMFHKQCKRMGVDWLRNQPLLTSGNDDDSIA